MGKPLFEIDPSWMPFANAPTGSPTSRWFHLDTLFSTINEEQMRPVEIPVVDWANLPVNTPPAADLRYSAWLCAEALTRHGIAREELSTEAIRWARQVGVALLGNRSRIGPGELLVPMDVVIRAVVSLFSAGEQPILQFALPSRFSRVEATLSSRAQSLLAQYPPQQLQRLMELARRRAFTQNSHDER